MIYVFLLLISLSDAAKRLDCLKAEVGLYEGKLLSERYSARHPVDPQEILPILKSLFQTPEGDTFLKRLDTHLAEALAQDLRRFPKAHQRRLLRGLAKTQIEMFENDGIGGSVGFVDEFVITLSAHLAHGAAGRIFVRHEFSHYQRMHPGRKASYDELQMLVAHQYGKNQGLLKEERRAFGDQYDYIRRAFQKEDLERLRVDEAQLDRLTKRHIENQIARLEDSGLRFDKDAIGNLIARENPEEIHALATWFQLLAQDAAFRAVAPVLNGTTKALYVAQRTDKKIYARLQARYRRLARKAKPPEPPKVIPGVGLSALV